MARMVDIIRKFSEFAWVRMVFRSRLTVVAVCVVFMLFPYLLKDLENPATIFKVPLGFFLISFICPIVLCVYVYHQSRSFAKGDLKREDDH